MTVTFSRRRGLALLVGCLLGSACTQVSNQPNLKGQDVHLTVIHTSDIHSRLFPYEFAPGQIDKNLGLLPQHGNMAYVGGAARIATVIKDIRATSSRVMHVDSGDIFQGAPVFNHFAGEVEMRAMDKLGLTGMALGNHEFDKGATNLALMKSRFGSFPIMAANYIFTDPGDPTQPKLRNVITQWTITNIGGLRVGIVGMGNLSSLQGIYEGGNSLGIRPLRTLDVIQDAVRTLRGQVDLLVLTTHLGLEEDEGLAQETVKKDDENLVAAIQGVDVIFGGHLHIVLNPPNRIPHPDGTFTVVCHSGAFAKYIGKLELVVHVADPEGAEPLDRRSHVKSYTYEVIPIDDRIKEDTEMAHMLEPYQVKMNLALRLGERFAVIPCPEDQATCPKVLRADSSGGDSQLGNLVATSMRLRKRVEADFAVTNTLGIRADFESGPLTIEQMYNVFPFENTITTMFLSGLEIREMLDFIAAKSGERGCRTQAQASGLWMVADCTNKISCGPFNLKGEKADRCHPEDRLLPEGSPARQDGPYLIGDNCLNAPENCKAVLPYASYRTAVNDYIANGGSGFTMLKRNTTKFNTGISLRDSLTDYIRTLTSRCGADKYPTLKGKKTSGKPCEQDKECGVGGVCNIQTCEYPYDYTTLPCLVPEGVEAHDGRITMVAP